MVDLHRGRKQRIRPTEGERGVEGEGEGEAGGMEQRAEAEQGEAAV